MRMPFGDSFIILDTSFLSCIEAVGEKKVKLVVGGFSQGCATALYITKCLIVGKYSSGKPFPDLKVNAIIGLGGWMPTIKTLEDEVKAVPNVEQRAQEIPIFFGHCEDDNVMPVRQSHSAASAFRDVGVKDITVQLYPEGGHVCIPEEAEDLCAWMVTKLGLDHVHIPE
ncbi:hypothetical protein M758_5G081300 [Ceratodon purpureus]|nr:hypothetical protein M758_5G081300 [Ceratodon purpureus]